MRGRTFCTTTAGSALDTPAPKGDSPACLRESGRRKRRKRRKRGGGRERREGEEEETKKGGGGGADRERGCVCGLCGGGGGGDIRKNVSPFACKSQCEQEGGLGGISLHVNLHV